MFRAIFVGIASSKKSKMVSKYAWDAVILGIFA